ncbi:hypothetical protein SARC_09523 [Sphaeroforma arctica JP610]|uniref:Sphingolipid delta4-desaturase N-terminal domain-containing protein n=1 Tax=Sphaeroforma arctica JP610 TaxID=667725 RepID=A0A0L0FMN8_9EUKA|nr:hypothetical protein SARC_09523 [Sphaeroforma arctica JP610]KNC78029.1 hypothetical protein SARC_09523 [Sphaeroforma arctica JP610]|eukprot:XP_014151931.1 hypothetical protein SARC_09523 [Sphaeroforma arctica JP610]
MCQVSETVQTDPKKVTLTLAEQRHQQRFAEVDGTKPKLDYEIHQERKRAILKEFPEVKKLYGNEPRTAYYAYAVIAVMLTLAYLCRNSYMLAIVFGFGPGPYLNAAVLVFIHEATHFLVWKTPAYNRILSIITNMVMCVPISEIFKQHHGAHHMNLGSEHFDVDVPTNFEVEFVGNSSFLKGCWLFFNMLILPARSLMKLPVRTDKFLIANWIACLGFGAVAFYLSLPSFVFLMLSLLNSQGLHPANARQIQRHVHDGSDEMKNRGYMPHTYSYYGPANKYFLNVGYHIEHHDFSQIPWTKLPELKRIAGEKWYPTGAAHKNRGMTELINFVTNPDISLADFGGH